MDLYEALKSGTSADELIKAFHADLDKANERIDKEKKEEEQKRIQADQLSDCRHILAEALIRYMEAYLNEDLSADVTETDIDKILESFEKEMNSLKAFYKTLTPKSKKTTDDTKTLKATSTVTGTMDGAIINDFLKGLL